MKKRLSELACRRRLLLGKIEDQRVVLGEISLHWKKPLARADTGLNAIRFIRAHPGLMSGGIAALLALRRNGIGGLLHKGWRSLRCHPFLGHLFSQ